MTVNTQFLHDRYDQLHATEMQLRLRRLAPWPVGCVFLPWPGMTEAQAREHFRAMKRLGFTCLKQTMATPEWPEARTLELALEEGIIPFWYGEAGFAEITPDLLKKVGLPPDMDPDKALEDPKVWAYQKEILRCRIQRKAEEAARRRSGAVDSDKVPGVIGDVDGHVLHPGAVPHFISWLEKNYGMPQNLAHAWNAEHVGISARALSWQNWDEVRDRFQHDITPREYRHIRDILRFRADMYIRDYVVAAIKHRDAIDPQEPLRAGGEMGLFLPFAARGTDMEGIAIAMAAGGSFYPSIHLAWHFEEVAFEVARPIYMQAQIAVDWAKGIWTAAWESTGGPQWFSGGKSSPESAVYDQIPGFTVDAGVITQLMLSWIAAGFKGFGLWCWNSRTAGWEAGEFSLLDRNNEITERAIRAGQIGKAARRLRRELWQAKKEPLVGILVSWENEAMWAAMAVEGRSHFKMLPVRSRIGASRALINANVPWEYVTPANLAAGLGPRYRAIYLPACIAITAELQQDLLAYVEQGGRLVLDMPGAYLDGYGRLLPTKQGSWFEQLFGAVLHEFTYANSNTPRALNGIPLQGFTAALTPTRAEILRRYDNGQPAITEAETGQGRAVILGAQASLDCWKPGNHAMEDLLIRTALGPLQSLYACEGALVYRLAAPNADHWFFINDAPSRKVQLRWRGEPYLQAQDVLTGEIVNLDGEISLEGFSGRWLRGLRRT